MTTPSRKILVVGPSWVGDMVMSQSLYRELKRQHPGCEIDVLAPGASRPLLARMPEVRRAIDIPLGHGTVDIGTRRKLGLSLRAEKYDQAILLPNSLKSALVPFFANIPKRTGWRGEMRYLLLNDMRVLDEKAYPLMVQQFVALALKKNAPPPQHWLNPQLVIDVDNRDAAIKKCGLALSRPAIALCATFC